MDKIEDFINNNIDASTLPDAPAPADDISERFSAFLERLRASAIQIEDFSIDRGKPPQPTDESGVTLAAMREENKMRRHLVTLRPDVYGVGGVAFVGGFSSDMVYNCFIEEYRVKYGDQWVNDAIDVARRSQLSIHDSITAKANAEALAQALNAMSVRIADVMAAFKTIGDDMARGFAQNADDLAQQPKNRHERRARKHSKPIQEGDQVWQRRARRKYRR